MCACWALQTLRKLETKKFSDGSGAIRSVLEIMEQHLDVAEIQKEACRTLAALVDRYEGM